MPLLRAPRTLPQVLAPETANAFLAALRTHRDRAMVEAMLFGGLRRCEVLGLRLQDVFPGERRVFVATGKGGHQRVVPISPRFFVSLAAYLTEERPSTATEHVFVVLKGARRGAPLTPAGLDEIVQGSSAASWTCPSDLPSATAHVSHARLVWPSRHSRRKLATSRSSQRGSTST